MSKPDNAEFISVALLNGNWDKADANFIPAAQMKTSTNQAITNNLTTKVAYDITAYDSYAARSEGAMVNLTNDEITIRKAGLYSVTALASFAANATGIRRLQIAKNGATITPFQQPTVSSGGSTSMIVHELLVLAVNDIISVNCFQTSGGNLDLTNLGFADGNNVCVAWLGNTT